jgi:hypothetical protein
MVSTPSNKRQQPATNIKNSNTLQQANYDNHNNKK